ncbi:MAG: exodeoxyribonuclease VII large subunit [Candidatus Hatepunaea meridiana]|nr:exodeoxyribonuclease VII large subunit [Candidatus Hatepunaea meridiana]
MKVAEEIYSISRLTRVIRNLIEGSIPNIWVEGEISNYTLNRSGHRYFTLKDSGAQISCTMWRTRRAPGFEFENGLKIRAYGRVTVWEQGGRYQLDVQSVLPAGLGPLQAAYEALKAKLNHEGLFDQERKRPLPKFPNAIGIATSSTGAAIRDLVWGFKTRFQPVELYLIPVKVQGEGAAEEIVRAIEIFNQSKLVDVIVVGRGGGSLEDLWAFNEEVVIRAIAASGLPVVSAVGHEVDVTLSDLAADVRAPTPTAAANLIVPDGEDIKQSLRDKSIRFSRTLDRMVSMWRERVHGLANSYGMKRVIGRVNDERLRIDDISEKLETALIRKVTERKRSFEAIRNQLTALSPNSVLDRGFCVARQKEGTIVKSAIQITIGDKLNLLFKRGSALAAVEEIHKNER